MPLKKMFYHLEKFDADVAYSYKQSLENLFSISAGLSSGGNKFYPTNGNNNVELENLYKYYKSTGQVK